VNRFHDGMYTSMIYGVVDATRGTLAYCNAGHLPPLRVSGGGAHLVAGNGTLVGVGAAAPPLVTVELAPGDRLVFVTDGLVERRNEPLDVGLDRMAAAALAAASVSVEELIDRLIVEVGPQDAPPDDIAVLALEYRSPT
jgi:serine phosphatase RsbU (regulator of sigma subunit)